MSFEAGVLFVCMGNICRSPTAEAVFATRAATLLPTRNLLIDSAATHGYHTGHAPDRRAQQVAKRHGVDLSSLRARQLVVEDFDRFDYVLVMDEHNLGDAKAIAPKTYRAQLQRLLEYAPGSGVLNVPDPYYGDLHGFDRAFELIDAAACGFALRLADTLSKRPGG